MFCYQCEQTASCTACTGAMGVCGKKEDTTQLQAPDRHRPITTPEADMKFILG